MDWKDPEQVRAYKRKYYHSNKEKLSAYNSEYYQKNKEQIKEREKEYGLKNKKRVEAYNSEYYQNNKENIRVGQRKYYQNNKEGLKVSHSEYYQKNKERLIAYTKEYHSNNKEKVLAQRKEYYSNNKEKVHKKTKKWRNNNPALVLQFAANRRAIKKRAIPKWLKNCPVESRRIYTIYLLSRLLAKADGIERHVDHMWPLSDGGPHWSGNLQVLTKEENLEKGAYSCPKLKKQMKLNLKEAKVLYAKAA